MHGTVNAPSGAQVLSQAQQRPTGLCESPFLRSLLGVKRTCRFAPQMSANDPKRTSSGLLNLGLRNTV